MDFDINELDFMIVDVMKYVRTEKQALVTCNGRPFAALSCRLFGDSEIHVDSQVLRPDVEHYLLCPANTKYTQIYHDEELIAVHLVFTKGGPQKAMLIRCANPDIKDAFVKLYACWSQKKAGYVCKCKSIIYNLFYMFYVANLDKSGEKIQDSMNYLHANYRSRSFSIQEMVDRSCLSQAYFRRIFKQQYSCTIVEFINRLRVDYAKSLIESDGYSIKEIAFMTGFDDEKYFSQVFKKITGIQPSKYMSSSLGLPFREANIWQSQDQSFASGKIKKLI